VHSLRASSRACAREALQCPLQFPQFARLFDRDQVRHDRGRPSPQYRDNDRHLDQREASAPPCLAGVSRAAIQIRGVTFPSPARRPHRKEIDHVVLASPTGRLIDDTRFPRDPRIYP
jgi:hypothetical protein